MVGKGIERRRWWRRQQLRNGWGEKDGDGESKVPVTVIIINIII